MNTVKILRTVRHADGDITQDTSAPILRERADNAIRNAKKRDEDYNTRMTANFRIRTSYTLLPDDKETEEVW
ncbi:hypothetical protein IU449_26830 [Nocardia higoensis]|uniref:Uncharacterized protein n=1 Tax=Nocardia higoensis TaxID=228599 RepID=A0ABS0DJ02_9NOCA|nr:hypothetical protein [Nocardia higoensis]MBF6358115.1 hypothetical protein [Nocardia higoensis]